MSLLRRLLPICVLVAVMGGISVAQAAAEAKPGAKDLVLRGDAKCTSCHDEVDAPEKLAIGKTRHGTLADKRTPTCTSCHGDSVAHVDNPQKTSPRPPVDVAYVGKHMGSADTRNDACLSCHSKDSKRLHWGGSTHQSRDVACNNCHQTHTAKDKVRDKRTQPEVCFTCHKEQRAQMDRPSHHPVPEGKMGCSDCHNAHGSIGPKLMKRDSVNETCYTCHMEKRGPFVRPHEPVNEDCSICHNPHGTTVENLLKYRPPFLCNECHTPHGGKMPQLVNQAPPEAVASGPGKWGVNYTMGRGCANCHTQVHGSNNPQPSNPNPQYLLR